MQGRQPAVKADRTRAYVQRAARLLGSSQPKDLLDQHFLCTDLATGLEVRALGFRDSADLHVAELGSGIGSVAQALPACRRLDLVELDPTLYQVARQLLSERSDIHVACADALGWIRRNPVDAVVSNLPGFLTTRLLDQLEQMAAADCAPSCVVAALPANVRASDCLPGHPHLCAEDLGLLDADWFWPRQQGPSRLVRLRPDASAM